MNRYKKYLVFGLVILIFLFVMSWNFGNFIVERKYKYSTTVDQQLQDVLDSIDKNDTKEARVLLVKAQEDIKFLQYICRN